MEEHALRSMMRRARSELEAPTALEAYRPRALVGAERATARNGVAVISAAGPLLKRAGFFTDLIGGTAYETIHLDLQAAIDNPSINAILLNVDSPGGEAAGVGELAAAVAGFRGVKPIVAYAGDLAASAGYWLASAADSIVIGAGAAVGSIGVRATYADSSARDTARGVQAVEFVSSQSPFKKSDLTTDQGRNRIQARIDSMAQVFVDTVASNRGVSIEHVLAAFGKGDVLIGKAAVAAGMADDIGTFEGTLAKLAAAKAPARRSPASGSSASRVGTRVAPVPAAKAPSAGSCSPRPPYGPLDGRKGACGREGKGRGPTRGHSQGRR